MQRRAMRSVEAIDASCAFRRSGGSCRGSRASIRRHMSTRRLHRAPGRLKDARGFLDPLTGELGLAVVTRCRRLLVGQPEATVYRCMRRGDGGEEVARRAGGVIEPEHDACGLRDDDVDDEPAHLSALPHVERRAFSRRGVGVVLVGRLRLHV